MSSPEEHTFQSKNTKFFQIEFSKESCEFSRELRRRVLGSDLSPVRRSAQLSGFTCGCRERDSGRPIGLIPRGVLTRSVALFSGLQVRRRTKRKRPPLRVVEGDGEAGRTWCQLLGALVACGLVEHGSTHELPDDVSPVVGILSHYSFLFFCAGMYAMREHSCWCATCSRVRGRGSALGTSSSGSSLLVPGCSRSSLMVWKEGKFTVSRAAGIPNRQRRLADLYQTLRKDIKPARYGCVQVRELWSETEGRHYRPGHFWLFEFGNAGDGSRCTSTHTDTPRALPDTPRALPDTPRALPNTGSIEKTFKLARRSWEVYKGVRFYDGEEVIVVKRWLHRLDEDASALTFVDWDPSADELDPDAQPAFMIVNSSELLGIAS